MKALIIGGNGLLGYGMTKCLTEKHWSVRSLDIRETPTPNRLAGVEYCIGDLFNETFLANAVQDVDTVFYFMSSTIPKMNDDYLKNEIEKTLGTMDYVLRVMVENDVKNFVFPSSGGAIYGDTFEGAAKESTAPAPKTAYGTGKLLCEQALKFYYQKHGISSLIFRIGNVYGSPLYRSTQQGVIDVFLQKALEGQPVTVWGNAEIVRDYIFLDDVTDAIERCAKKKPEGIHIYNVGTGVGSSVQDIIRCINAVADRPLIIEHDTQSYSAVERSVLSIEKIQKELQWSPTYDLQRGIRATLEIKKKLYQYQTGEPK